MKFEINQCPLCGKILQLRQVSGVSMFCCSTTSPHHRSHYEVEFNARNSIQHLYVGSFSVDNFDTAAPSRIYAQATVNGSSRWQLVKEVGFVRADSEEKLLNRIENLMR